MKKVTVKQKSYDLVYGFKDNDRLRAGFNTLAENTFDFNFEAFYQNGYWGDAYLPYALMDGDRLVANASVNILDLVVLGVHKRCIQIGTVMTDRACRNMGHSRFLLETIIEEWQGQSELIYLFANDTVLDFYPRFGFQRKPEFCCTKEIGCDKGTASPVRMDMSLAANRELLSYLVESTLCFGQLCALRNRSLVMFYATSFMSENFYRLADLDAVVCAEYHDDTLHLNDIFCLHEISIDRVIDAMTTSATARVMLGFTPTDTTAYRTVPYTGEDTLFVMGNAAGIFDEHRLMFPVLSHA